SLLLEITPAGLRFFHHRLLLLYARFALEAIKNRQSHLQAPRVSIEQLGSVLTNDTVVGNQPKRRESFRLDCRKSLLCGANAFLLGDKVRAIRQSLSDEGGLIRNRFRCRGWGERIGESDIRPEW